MLRSNQPFEDPTSPALPFRWAIALLAALFPLPVAFLAIVFLGEALMQLCPSAQVELYRCTAAWFAPISIALSALIISSTAFFVVALPTRLAPGSKPTVARGVAVLGIAFYLTLFVTGVATTVWPFAVWCLGCASAGYLLWRRYNRAA